MASIRTRTNGKGQRRYAVLYVSADGRQRSRTYGRKDDAQREKTRIEREHDLGTPYDPQASKTLLRDYAKTWLTSKRKTTKAGSVTTYERALRRHILPAFGHRGIGSLRRDEVREWAHGLDLGPKSVSVYVGVLRDVLNEAVRDDLIAKSPCQGLKLPRVEQPKVQPLTMAQVGDLRDALPERHRPLVTLGIATGMRVGEVTGLTYGAVGSNHIEVRATLTGTSARWSLQRPKTDRSWRTIPVPASVVDTLGSGDDGALVFTDGQGRPLTSATFSAIWRTAVANADLVPPGTTFHHLRHTYASLLIDAGENPKVLQDRLGHATIGETMDTYGHLFPESEERTRSTIDTALTSMVP